jgi:diguanylate cyclase (GGDEF)-like protein/PAS domain S-box-containing protein
VSVARLHLPDRLALRHALSAGWATRASLLLVAYYVLGRLGLALPQFGGHVTLFWAPAGVALAALVRFGPRLWPAVAIAAFAVAMSTGLAPAVALLVAVGNTLGPALGAALMRREGLHSALDRRRDLWLFVGIGIALAMTITATNGVFWLAASGRIGRGTVPAAWLQWWLGDALSAVLVGVPVLTCTRAAVDQATKEGRWRTTFGLAVATVASAALAFTVVSAAGFETLLLFVPHLLLCGLAIASGLFAAACTGLALAAFTVLATAHGAGPFHLPEAGSEAVFLAGYLASAMAIPLLATALVGETGASERLWRLALDAAEAGVAEWDLIRGRVVLSPRWLGWLGQDAEPAGETLDSFWSRLHPDDAVAVKQAFEPLRGALATGVSALCRMRRSDGRWQLLELHAQVSERGPGGEPLRMLTTARDRSAQQASEDALRTAQNVFHALHEGVLITDADHRVIDANPAYAAISGWSIDELRGGMPSLLRPAPASSDAAARQASMRAALAADGHWLGELHDRRRNGDASVLQVRAAVVAGGESGGPVRCVYAVLDVTESRQQLDQLKRQAHFDELTRLPNRARLAQMLDEALQTSQREGSLLTVCYLDLDHFKPVNDQFGHEAGDRLLLELANRMRRSLRSWAGGDDVVARIGGDEFVLLLRTATLEESRHAVERVLHQICQPYALGFGLDPVMVTASIGATVYPLDGADAETLLRHADHAMYGAKQAGRNGYLFFDAEHDRRAEARFVALGRVQEALDAREFRLYYQPKVDMPSGVVTGVEALLRWRHPDKGVISPAQFLPLIENTGLSGSVGNWVLQQGIEQLAAWLGQGLDITVSVNVSARHLQDPLFARHLAVLLARYDANVARHLIVEVLETAALADIDYTCALMEECRSLGVRFALDDFGTGYSTFTYLKRLPIDMLKIDRSFITNMLSDRHDLAIVEGVIGLSQTFGCSVVAEGVETPEQAQRLIEIGCSTGQGNGIAPAMPADEVAGWIAGYAGLLRPGTAPLPG